MVHMICFSIMLPLLVLNQELLSLSLSLAQDPTMQQVRAPHRPPILRPEIRTF